MPKFGALKSNNTGIEQIKKFFGKDFKIELKTLNLELSFDVRKVLPEGANKFGFPIMAMDKLS